MLSRSRKPSVRLWLLAAVVPWTTVWLTACSRRPAETEEVVRPVKTLTLGEAGTGIVRTFPGKVEAGQKVDLAFKVSGPLVELPVSEGQRVAEGTVLARIDRRDFETQVNSAEGALEQAQASLTAMRRGARPEDRRRLEAQRDAAKATMTEAQNRLERIKALVEQRAATASEYDDAVKSFEVANGNYQQALQELEIGKRGAREEDIQAKEAEIKQLEAKLKEAKDALEDTYLRASFEGLVAARYVENFQNVQAKQPIVALQDVSEIEIVVDVPESFLSLSKEDIDQVKARFPVAPGREFEVSTKEFRTEADPVTQTYKATLAMPRPEELIILPGASAMVDVHVKPTADEASGHFLVPITAVFDEGGKHYVWIVNRSEMTVGRRQVTVGNPSGESIEVTSGLEKGDMIATAGVHHLDDGVKIRSLNESSDA